MMKTKHFEPGSRVRLTGAFLRSTGQIAGGEGSRIWRVQKCECRNCKTDTTVAINQLLTMCDPSSPDYDQQYVNDLVAEGSSTWRHIATCNLSQYGKPDTN